MTQTTDIELLFRTHYRALCLYAAHYVDDIATAEDIVMDCFVRLYERSAADDAVAPQPDGLAAARLGSSVTHAKSYLYQMVRNASVDHLRSQGAVAAAEGALPLESIGDVADTSAEEEQALQERSEREARLWAAIDRLPQACRNVLLMSKRDGMKNREIAETLGISLKTVEAQLTKAYSTLRGKAREIYMFFF